MKLRLPGLFFIFIALSWCALAQEAAKEKKPAPLFEVTSLKGKALKLEELKGKYVVLNFWFIHCAPCVKELPKLNKLVTAYGKRNFVFIAFAMDNKYELEDFLKKKPFTYNIIPKGLPVIMKYHDPSDPGVSFPTHVIIDPQGEIVFQAEGASALGPLQKELKRLAALK
jgi:peroxiredoxin